MFSPVRPWTPGPRSRSRPEFDARPAFVSLTVTWAGAQTSVGMFKSGEPAEAVRLFAATEGPAAGSSIACSFATCILLILFPERV